MAAIATSPIAGIDNALKMRQMFIETGYLSRIDIEPNGYSDVVAVVQINDSSRLYFAAYYFREDGSYFRGIN